MAGSTFVFHNPRVERIVSGPGAIGKLAEEVERLGGKRALVVSSPSVAKTFCGGSGKILAWLDLIPEI